MRWPRRRTRSLGGFSGFRVSPSARPTEGFAHLIYASACLGRGAIPAAFTTSLLGATADQVLGSPQTLIGDAPRHRL